MIDFREKQKDNLEFIKYVKVASKLKWSRNKFAELIGIQVNSVRRRVLNIKTVYGVPMPELPLTNKPVSITDEDRSKFAEVLSTIDSGMAKANDFAKSVMDGKNTRQVGTYVITSAQNATPVHEGFLKSLHNYCDANNAKLIVIPYRYKNPTSVFAMTDQTAEWWSPKVEEYLLEDAVRLCKDLMLIASVKIQPTAVQPLSGFEGYTGTSSAIFGHPKVQQKTVPTPSKMLPKILLTTGAITVPNYTDSKSGFKGEFHHSFAAAVVTVTEDEWHVRHVHAKDDGSFYDLDSHYTQDGFSRGHRAAALITGDTHAIFIDPAVEKATYSNADSICNVLRPEMRVFHDLNDFWTRNHHHVGNDIISIGKYQFDMDDVESELQIAADFLDRYNDPESVNVIVKSNHDEALDRWLREADPKRDPANARFYHYMKYNQIRSIKKVDTGFSSFDPFEFWCNSPDMQRGLKSTDNTVFLARDQSLMVAGIELSFHGDRGANGARGSVQNFAKIGPKVVIGHSHSPGIYEGAYQVGTSSRLDLEYQSGPSSWMSTHCIIYQDGSRTLINIINGKWR